MLRTACLKPNIRTSHWKCNIRTACLMMLPVYTNYSNLMKIIFKISLFVLTVPGLSKIEKYFYHLKIFKLHLVDARPWKNMVLLPSHSLLVFGNWAYNIVALLKSSAAKRLSWIAGVCMCSCKVAIIECCYSYPNLHVLQSAGNC